MPKQTFLEELSSKLESVADEGCACRLDGVAEGMKQVLRESAQELRRFQELKNELVRNGHAIALSNKSKTWKAGASWMRDIVDKVAFGRRRI